jgi:mono/diheme cytochrome c family protein
MMPRLVVLLIRGLGVVSLGLEPSRLGMRTGIASDQAPTHALPESNSRPVTSAQVYRSACLRCHDIDGKGGRVRDTFPTIPDFTSTGWHASRADEDLVRAILQGKGRAMSPMRKKLGSLDVMHMVSFVRAFRGGGLVVTDELASPSSAAQDDERANQVPANGPLLATVARSQPPSGIAVQPAPVSGSTLEAGRSARRPSPGAAERSRAAAASYGWLCASCHGRDGRALELRAAVPSVPDFCSRQWQETRDDAHLTASILDGKGTSMPAWRGRLRSDQVRDLVAFVRGLGPPGSITRRAPASEFARRFRALQEEWDELDRQVKALRPGTGSNIEPGLPR